MTISGATIHHIGIVSTDIECSIETFENLFGYRNPDSGYWSGGVSTVNSVHTNDVQFNWIMLEGADSDTFIEIYEPIQGRHRDYLDEHGHHSIAEICFEVGNITDAYDSFVTNGIMPVTLAGKPLTDTKYQETAANRVFFLPENDTEDYIIEILELGDSVR